MTRHHLTDLVASDLAGGSLTVNPVRPLPDVAEHGINLVILAIGAVALVWWLL